MSTWWRISSVCFLVLGCATSTREPSLAGLVFRDTKEQTATVRYVLPGGAADLAGLAAGDEILQVGRARVRTRGEVLRALKAASAVGECPSLSVRRESREVALRCLGLGGRSVSVEELLRLADAAAPVALVVGEASGVSDVTLDFDRSLTLLLETQLPPSARLSDFAYCISVDSETRQRCGGPEVLETVFPDAGTLSVIVKAKR